MSKLQQAEQQSTSPLFKYIAVVAVLLAAFLMFLIQPLVAKAIVPWFGGAAATWSVVMLYFQALLLLGYLTSFLLQNAPAKVQCLVYIIITIMAMIFSYTQPVFQEGAIDNENPVGGILWTLLRYITFPGLLLATVSTMVQVWYSNVYKQEPYILYSISNTGSLLALLSYPFFIEPYLTLGQTFSAWQALLVLCAISCAALAVLQLSSAPSAAETAAKAVSTPWRSTWSRIFAWIYLPACSTALLVSITHYLCHDIAPIPLLWILPLALYLITYILAFGPARRISELVWVWLSMIAIGLFMWASFKIMIPTSWFLSTGLFLLFVVCQFCHSYLVALRPGPDRLTTFYLCLAVGGFLGSALVNLISPFIFVDNSDIWLCLIGATLAMAYRVFRTGSRTGLRGRPLALAYRFLFVLLGSYVVLSEVIIYLKESDREGKERNFYGILKVFKTDTTDTTGKSTNYDVVNLHHGVTTHGKQFLDPKKASIPTTYYGTRSGVGTLLNDLRAARPGPLSIGVIGLGAGTLSAYTREGDSVTYYEINSAVIRIAERDFTYIRDSKARTQTVLGDARLSLAAAPPQQFDVLVLDAFSSDAVPAHLLTREAFAIYLKHVKPDGFLAVHISNRYLDLRPVIAGAAAEYNLKGIVARGQGDKDTLVFGSVYVLLSRNDFELSKNDHLKTEPLANVKPVLWTDDYSNLFRIIIW